jgi:transposase
VDQGGVAHAQKKWLMQGRTILFADESNFYLLPCVVKSWAPIGQTPIIKWQANFNHLKWQANFNHLKWQANFNHLKWQANFNHLKWQANFNHLSAACAISEQGELWEMVKSKEGTFNSGDVVKFLRHLLSSIEGKLGIVWDGVSVHRSKEVKQFLSEEGLEASGRIELVRLPAYAPDLNPAEGIWSYLKCVELRNLACHNLTHLRHVLTEAFATLQSSTASTDIVRSCFHQPGCY